MLFAFALSRKQWISTIPRTCQTAEQINKYKILALKELRNENHGGSCVLQDSEIRLLADEMLRKVISSSGKVFYGTSQMHRVDSQRWLREIQKLWFCLQNRINPISPQISRGFCFVCFRLKSIVRDGKADTGVK